MVPAGSRRISRVLRYSGAVSGGSGLRVRGSHPLRRSFPAPSPGLSRPFLDGPTTPRRAFRHPRFGLRRFRSPLLALSLLFSFPPGTEMFQFPGFAPGIAGWRRFPPPGCPIRKSAHLRAFAPPRGLSQLVTSFLASGSQGILHAPCSPFLFSFSRPATGVAPPAGRRRKTSDFFGCPRLTFAFVFCCSCFPDCAFVTPSGFHHVNVRSFSRSPWQS